MSDTINFNGHDLSSLVMCRPHKPIMAPVNIASQAVGGRHGKQFRRALLDAYDIPVEIWVRSEDRADVAQIRHTLAEYLWSEAPAPLYLPDDPDLYHLAIVRGDTDLGAITSELPKTTIKFHVLDPIAFGEEKQESLTSTAKSITVGGSWPSYPIITSTLSGGTWKLTNNTTTEFVEVNAKSYGATPASGATLICDMEKEQVTINGSTAGVAMTSDFFSIKGTVSLLVTGASATTMKWRERWL